MRKQDLERRFPLGVTEKRFYPGRLWLGRSTSAGNFLRADDVSDQMGSISGYAAVYFNPADPGTEYELYSDLTERILPGAFDRALREGQDIRCLWNHNADFLLGRTKSGTCRCYTDDRGLVYTTKVGNTSIGRDVLEHIRRGDCDGSSFSFRVVKQSFTDGQNGGPDIREIEDVNLFDVSPVCMPAYESSTAKVGTSPRSWFMPQPGKPVTFQWTRERIKERGREAERWLQSQGQSPPRSKKQKRKAIKARAEQVSKEVDALLGRQAGKKSKSDKRRFRYA